MLTKRRIGKIKSTHSPRWCGHTNNSEVDLDNVVLARWSNAPTDSGDVWIIAALLHESNQDGPDQIRAGVLRRDGHVFHLIARSSPEKLHEFASPSWNPSLQLDLIPYRISPQETAFGVRILDSYNSTSHSDNSGVIDLYRFKGNTLTLIFSALTSWSTYDKVGAADCTHHLAGVGKEPNDAQQAQCDGENTVDQEYVLAFIPNMTLGHYDLSIRTRSTKNAPGKGIKRVVWNGTTYKPQTFEGQ
ncbi:hypothetical protein [Burkholderia sp. LMG 32019]|uniref:hypothetical protein n=1 Tax=Burkholderia sp. LMG 32019 TaxID=3158173 RepID=UPI003C2B297E